MFIVLRLNFVPVPMKYFFLRLIDLYLKISATALQTFFDLKQKSLDQNSLMLWLGIFSSKFSAKEILQ